MFSTVATQVDTGGVCCVLNPQRVGGGHEHLFGGIWADGVDASRCDADAEIGHNRVPTT